MFYKNTALSGCWSQVTLWIVERVTMVRLARRVTMVQTGQTGHARIWLGPRPCVQTTLACLALLTAFAPVVATTATLTAKAGLARTRTSAGTAAAAHGQRQGHGHPPRQRAPPPRPHILINLIDDLGWYNVGFNGNPESVSYTRPWLVQRRVQRQPRVSIRLTNDLRSLSLL